jgi:hypothetical protein
VGPPPRGSHITETTLQNRQMTKNEWFQEFEGQRFLVFVFDGQNQTLTIVRWPKMDFFLFFKEPLDFYVFACRSFNLYKPSQTSPGFYVLAPAFSVK